jgi:hypothetical protein
MNKRIVARVGSYINKQTGEEKKEYQNLGVILTNDNGEYGLLDPCINLAGVLLKQNILAAKEGKQQRDKVAFSIFEDQPKNDNNYNRSPEYNQTPPPQQAPTQGQYQQPQPQYQQPPSPVNNAGFAGQ